MKDFAKKIKLPKIAKRHPIAFSVAVALHFLLLIGLLFSSVQRLDKKPKEQHKKVTSRAIPKAVTVDLSEIKKEKQRLVSKEKKKQAKLRRQEIRLKELEDRRYRKQRKINQLKVKEKKRKKAKALAEKRAKEAEKERKKIEKKRKAEAKKFKEEQKKRALSKKRQLEEDKKRQQVQKNILDELKASYINQIAARVRENWRYSGAKDDWSCVVHLSQDNSGNVKDVKLKSCNVNDKNKEKYFKNAIIRAVKKASPLPAAPDKSVFDSKIIFDFRVN